MVETKIFCSVVALWIQLWMEKKVGNRICNWYNIYIRKGSLIFSLDVICYNLFDIPDGLKMRQIYLGSFNFWNCWRYNQTSTVLDLVFSSNNNFRSWSYPSIFVSLSALSNVKPVPSSSWQRILQTIEIIHYINQNQSPVITPDKDDCQVWQHFLSFS